MAAVTVELGSTVAVDGVDLSLAAGEWLGLIGPNGAGKSTLLRAAAGLVAHTGTVAISGNVAPGPQDVAFVPQNPIVPDGMSVAEYALIGRTAHLGWLGRESAEDRDVVASVLRRLDLASFARRPVGSLSGGERQRVIIARALAQEAPVLLLDEPTSALDIGHQTEVLEIVDELRHQQGLSVLAVMHDLTTAARFADRLALLDRGRVVSVGSPEEVLAPEALSEVYRTPLTVRQIDGDLVVLSVPRRRPASPATDVP
jgi:iron complex transport system ATP-binding protein